MSRLLPFLALAVVTTIGAMGLSLSAALPAAAQDSNNPSGLEVPRFETIGQSTVNMRQGPSTDHRKLWIFVGQEGLPVEVIAETERWRQIRDPEGDIGWVHVSLLSSSRGVVIDGGLRPLRRRPTTDAQTVAYLEPRVVANLIECSADWCQISTRGYTGWVLHSDVWGVYAGEIVE